MLRQLPFIALLALLFAGCSATRVPPPASADGPALVFQRGSCLGECPVFEVEVFADGRMHFLPQHFTRETAPAWAERDVSSLLRLVADARLDTLEALYFQPIADIPTYTLRYEGVRIRWNTGAPDILDELRRILEPMLVEEGWLFPASASKH